MFSLETLNIAITDIKDDSCEASYQLDDDYFKSLDNADIEKGSVNASVSIRKAAEGEFTLLVSVEGNVTVQCDRCLDDMLQPIKAESSYIVKLGHSSGETDDTIYVDETEGILNPSWLIYESIALAVPIKHVHAPGKCNCAMIEKLNELSATRSGDETAAETIDPRWNELLKLKN